MHSSYHQRKSDLYKIKASIFIILHLSDFVIPWKKIKTVYNSIRLWYMFKTIIVYVWGRLCDKKQWYFMKCDGFCHILWNQTTIQYGRFIERKKAFYMVVFVIWDILSMWKILWYRTSYLCVTVCDMRHLIYVVQFVIWDILSMWYSLWYQTTYLCGTVCDMRHLIYVVQFVISDNLSMWYSLWYETSYVCGTFCDIRQVLNYWVDFVTHENNTLWWDFCYQTTILLLVRFCNTRQQPMSVVVFVLPTKNNTLR